MTYIAASMKTTLTTQLSLLGRTDLHTHTTASDGFLSPTALVEKAARYGISVLAISDHDTTDALDEAQVAAAASNVELLTACELTCSEGGHEYHLLAYCFDKQNEALQNHLRETRRLRRSRAEAIIAKLNERGIALTMEEVVGIAGGDSIVRPHIAAGLVKIGAVQSTQEAFDRYLSNFGPAYVPIGENPIDVSIPIIHAAGGIAVIAHPGRSISPKRVVELIGIGMDGIEVYHPSHNRQQLSHYRNLAKSYKVLATGGSDYHGNRDYDESSFGRYSVDLDVVTEMKARAARNAGK